MIPSSTSPPFSQSLHNSPSLAPQQHSIVARELYSSKHQFGPKIIIIMSGLPARGKSYICKKLKRYLNWMGFRTCVFNVGDRRRLAPGSEGHDAAFFDPHNSEAQYLRNRFAIEVLDEMMQWLRDGGNVAIHDATNTTMDRRRALVSRIRATFSDDEVTPVVIESRCTDQSIIQANIRMKVHSPDYAHVPRDQAIHDFSQRLQNYERAYQAVGPAEEEDQVSYILIENVGTKVTAYRIRGYLESQMVFYLMNIHVVRRTIWLSTHGHSALATADSAVPVLTERGRRYAAALNRFMEERYPSNLVGLSESILSTESDPLSSVAEAAGTITNSQTNGNPSQAPPNHANTQPNDRFSSGHHLEVWTSMLRRSIEMAEYLSPTYTYKHSNVLNEMYTGEFERIVSAHDDKDRQTFTALFIERLKPLIIEMERVRHSMLIIARDVVLALIYAYFFEIEPKEAVREIRVPEHSIVGLRTMPFGTELMCYFYDELSDTFVERPGMSLSMRL